MAVSSTHVALALKVIRDANIAHPGEELLDCFIRDSVDQEHAANYLLRRCPPSQSIVGLDAFLSDWTQLVSACKRSLLGSLVYPQLTFCSYA